MEQHEQDIPDWLLGSQGYEPRRDRDGFIAKSMLSITGVLAQFRLDDGAEWRFSPSAPMKLLFALGCILLTSLSTNYFFVLVMLACLLVRLCFMPAKALKRIVAVAFGAAGVTFLVMLPAMLIGQPHSALLIATKVLVSVGIAMTAALTTPYNRMTAALRTFHVPNLVILTIDLALKSIVRLGEIALEVLAALRLRSVGRNEDKRTSLGGVGVISVFSNICPKQSHDIVAQYLAGNTAESCRLQLEALPLIHALFCEVNPIPVKGAMNILGMEVGPLRLPLTELTPQNREKLKSEMKSLKLLDNENLLC